MKIFIFGPILTWSDQNKAFKIDKDVSKLLMEYYPIKTTNKKNFLMVHNKLENTFVKNSYPINRS